MVLFLLIFTLAACDQKAGEQHESTNNHNGQTQSLDNQPYIFTSNSANRNEENVTNNPTSEVHDLGNGFKDHGVAVPIATSRGTVATIDQQGHHLILMWLYDHRGTYSLLMIDTDQETSEQFFLPFNGPSYTSILASNNRYYTHFNGRFVEFNPDKRDFTFIGKTSKGSAMSMTEDDNGVIWAALMPNCNIVSYNPKTDKLKDYGSVHSQKGRQLPRSIVADDNGWVYVTAGSPGKEEIKAFNPKTGETNAVQKKADIPVGSAYLLRQADGKVYGRVKGKGVMELIGGEFTTIEKKNNMDLKNYIAGTQALFHNTFPDGKVITGKVSPGNAGFLRSREVIIKNPKTDETREIAFDYKTEGADLMGVAASSNEMIIGGSMFPMTFFQYDPNKGNWTRHNANGQFNTLAIEGDEVFIGKYPHGELLRWNQNKDWILTRKGKKKTNPQYLAEAHPYIYRPHDLLAYPDGRTIILAGRPSGSRTAGGLLFWDRKSQEADILKHLEELPNQSTQSLVALPDGRILGGTTIKPGDSGGKRLAKEAELYIMGVESREIEWAKAVIPGVVSYQDLCITPDGIVLGVAGRGQFFVFDPQKRKILKQTNLKKTFDSRIPYTQGQRSFIKSPEGDIYLLLQSGILKVDPQNYDLSLLAKAPEKITGGGAYFNGRIYYTGGGRSRIHSYTLP